MTKYPGERYQAHTGLLVSETVGSVETKFNLKAYGRMVIKTSSNQSGHMTKMAAMFIYGKNIKNLLLQNQLTKDLETWYVAFNTQVLPRLFK